MASEVELREPHTRRLPSSARAPARTSAAASVDDNEPVRRFRAVVSFIFKEARGFCCHDSTSNQVLDWCFAGALLVCPVMLRCLTSSAAVGKPPRRRRMMQVNTAPA